MNDFESALSKLDKNGLLILMVTLGQRAIELLQEDKPKKDKPSLVLPNQELICPPAMRK